MRMLHEYEVEVEWTGAGSEGTSGHRSYSRQHVIRVAGLPEILGSADRTFHGDADRHNPEHLLVAALTQCHMMSYLHQAVRLGVVVTAYRDRAVGTLATSGEGGRFTGVTLRPVITIADVSQAQAALDAHGPAGQNCFIAASVAFPVRHEPTILVAGEIVAGGGA